MCLTLKAAILNKDNLIIKRNRGGENCVPSAVQYTCFFLTSHGKICVESYYPPHLPVEGKTHSTGIGPELIITAFHMTKTMYLLA